MSDINKYSILDIDGAADVVNNLLDKLGTAVGWGVNRETPERIAIATYIEDIKNSDYDSLLKAALISQAKTGFSCYSCLSLLPLPYILFPGVEVYYTVSPIVEDRMRYLHFARIRTKECQQIF